MGSLTKGALTGLQLRGFTGVFVGAMELSFFASWISAFSLSFADNFFEGTEEGLSLEVAVEGAVAGLEHLRAGFSGLTNEVPAWLAGTGKESS